MMAKGNRQSRNRLEPYSSLHERRRLAENHSLQLHRRGGWWQSGVLWCDLRRRRKPLRDFDHRRREWGGCCVRAYSHGKWLDGNRPVQLLLRRELRGWESAGNWRGLRRLRQSLRKDRNHYWSRIPGYQPLLARNAFGSVISRISRKAWRLSTECW